ncbi:unnamed protein product, partial [Cladocopium goreaui]
YYWVGHQRFNSLVKARGALKEQKIDEPKEWPDYSAVLKKHPEAFEKPAKAKAEKNTTGVKKKEENTTQTGRLRVQDAVGSKCKKAKKEADAGLPDPSQNRGAFVAMARYVPFILLWLAWFSLGTCGAKTQKKDLDMSTGLTEKDWFVASERLAELDAYCEQWEGLRSLHVFDFFSHSRRVSCSFERKGFRARSYDIRSSPSEDILSRAGMAGIWRRVQSQVRMANMIAENALILISLALKWPRTAFEDKHRCSGPGKSSPSLDAPKASGKGKSPPEDVQSQHAGPEQLSKTSPDAPEASGKGPEQPSKTSTDVPEASGKSPPEDVQSQHAGPEQLSKTSPDAPEASGKGPEQPSKTSTDVPEASGKSPPEDVQSQHAGPEQLSKTSPDAPEASGKGPEQPSKTSTDVPEASGKG